MLAFFVLMTTPVSPADEAPGQAAQSPRGTGARVVATITTLEGTVHMAGDSGRAASGGRTVLASTVTDTARQVMSPDVPPVVTP